MRGRDTNHVDQCHAHADTALARARVQLTRRRFHESLNRCGDPPMQRSEPDAHARAQVCRDLTMAVNGRKQGGSVRKLCLSGFMGCEASPQAPVGQRTDSLRAHGAGTSHCRCTAAPGGPRSNAGRLGRTEAAAARRRQQPRRPPLSDRLPPRCWTPAGAIVVKVRGRTFASVRGRVRTSSNAAWQEFILPSRVRISAVVSDGILLIGSLSAPGLTPPC